MSLNKKSSMIRPSLIDLNPIELNYYPFMINLDECNGGWKAANNLPTNIWVPSETKDVNVTVPSEDKRLVKHLK